MMMEHYFDERAEQREKEQQVIIDERKLLQANMMREQLLDLIEGWRETAHSHYYQNYNREMANGLQKAANDLENLLSDASHLIELCNVREMQPKNRGVK